MSVDVGYIRITDQDESGNVNFLEALQCRLDWTRLIRVRHVLRIGDEQVEKPLLGGLVAGSEQILVFGPVGKATRDVVFLEGLGVADATIEEMVGIGGRSTRVQVMFLGCPPVSAGRVSPGRDSLSLNLGQLPAQRKSSGYYPTIGS